MTNRHLTIRDIVSSVQDHAQSDEEAVAVIMHLFRTGRVLFTTPHDPDPRLVH